jgi:hypothetical protein
MALLWAACAGSGSTSQSRSEPALPPPLPATPPDLTEEGPPPTEAQRGECKAAQAALTAAIAASAEGCRVDDDCDVFQTCHPVLASTTPTLWKLHSSVQVSCRPVNRSDEIVESCAVRPRCNAGTCVRR